MKVKPMCFLFSSSDSHSNTVEVVSNIANNAQFKIQNNISASSLTTSNSCDRDDTIEFDSKSLSSHRSNYTSSLIFPATNFLNIDHSTKAFDELN
jgi:hypothetical protein